MVPLVPPAGRPPPHPKYIARRFGRWYISSEGIADGDIMGWCTSIMALAGISSRILGGERISGAMGLWCSMASSQCLDCRSTDDRLSVGLVAYMWRLIYNHIIIVASWRLILRKRLI